MTRTWYYRLKPWLPWELRMGLRRVYARCRRRRVRDVWPVYEPAGAAPDSWPGWPDGTKFAFVLTHDVEGARGVGLARKLLELDESLGFRASFNFVPEGRVHVPGELREELARRGFEVGVHDLRHDGKLYRSERAFRRAAERINAHLESWGAVGFRSAFMLHRLEWLHRLNILYDSSTFDTDPFEPQPDGVHTIFPFWVPDSMGGGYVELPYTLPQDSTLYLVLREIGPDIWKRKLDWIAERGGMALVNVHPDYIAFSPEIAGRRTYPASFYSEFLEYVIDHYRGQFWQPLPREAAAYITGRAKLEPSRSWRGTPGSTRLS